MTSASSSAISPGVLISLHGLIYYVNSEGQLSASEAFGLVSNSGYLGGALPATDGISAGLRFGLLEMSAGNLILSEYSVTRIVPQCTSEEPQIPSLRQILLKVVTDRVPRWMAFYVEDKDAFSAAIPDAWLELLEEAELFDFSDEIVVAWWREVLFEHHNAEEKRLKEIGDVGENLTVLAERGRLTREDISVNPHSAVIWVARLSSDFGYDVRSLTGERFECGNGQSDHLYIEVKSSVIEDRTTFRFRLSRNEWRTALANLENYFFFCWTGVSVSSQSAKSGPHVIPAAAFTSHVPTNRGEICEWSECAFSINLDDYSEVYVDEA